MSSVVIAGDTSGSVTLQAPAVAGTTVLTLPATSGTVLTTTGGVAPGTSGNVLTSNGTTWTSATPTSPIGVGQVYSLPTRTSGTTYTNSGTKPIMVVLTISGSLSGSGTLTVIVGGITIASPSYNTTASGSNISLTTTFIVPPGLTYSATVTSNYSINRWAELS